MSVLTVCSNICVRLSVFCVFFVVLQCMHQFVNNNKNIKIIINKQIILKNTTVIPVSQ